MKSINYEAIKNPEQFLTNFLKSINTYSKAMAFAVEKVHDLIDEFGYDGFPDSKVENNRYNCRQNDNGWTTGFFTGMIWLAYEWTKDEKLKEVALHHVKNFDNRLIQKQNLNHHDIGFLYSTTSVAGYKILNDSHARDVGLRAAELLSTRYVTDLGIIDRGPVKGLPVDEYKRFIIDCSMNVPLLFWASCETGNKTYYDMAVKHMENAVEYALRDNGSTYQEVTYNLITGEIKKTQGQGYEDESNWARGQAWAMYGLAITYRYTGDERFLELSRRMTNYFLNRLPDDLICGWDLVFTENDSQRDTSAATPAICGMLELAKHLPITDPERKIYENAALKMLETLSTSYTSAKVENSNGILLHGVYSFHRGTNIDDLCIWGDYYYMEALLRIMQPWNPYW